MQAKQQEIIAALGVKPTIQPIEEIEKRTKFLADYLEQAGLNGFVLGVSGGQDSLLAGIITQHAVDICNKNNREAYFHTMLLPYGIQHDRADAELSIEIIKSNSSDRKNIIEHDLNIKTSVDAMVKEFANECQPIGDFNKGNIKARMRMIGQYAIAGEYGLLVVGADHAAESVTGFFTKFGDGAADIMPLSGLTKRQGRAMLEVLNIPESLLNKMPTADLLDNNPIQPDETELGISYTEIDDYLEGKTISPKVAKIIENFYEKTQHKRNLPIQYRDNK